MHPQIRIEELQRLLADIFVQSGPVDPGRVDAGGWKVVASELVAFIAEDFMIDRTGLDVEPGARDKFRRERRVVLRGVVVSLAPTMR
jgi:hypothetical protein